MKHPHPFLYYVALDLKNKFGNDMSCLTLVFPNKRASLFFKNILTSVSSEPIWSPTYTTISDLFKAHSKFEIGDDIKLICDLYRSFVACTGSTETLDQFYGWGTVLLNDFDDIDKSLTDAHQLFANISDLHAYDTADYLTDEQINVLKHFFKDFDEHQTSKLKEKFLQLWSRLGDIYDHYKELLSKQGLAYEGALFRDAVRFENDDFGCKTYAFVGFNALQEVERKLFHHLKSKEQAIFYWDYDRFYTKSNIKGSHHEAGSLIMKFANEFTNELDNNDDEIYNNLEQPKNITFTSSPTESIQARYVGQWLQDEERVNAGNRTAIVMCNEQLLPTIIHSIPQGVKDINITTGFPLSQTAVASMVVLLCELAFMGCSGKDKYRQKYVASILRHPYTDLLSPLSATLCEKLATEHKYFPNRKELTLDDGLSLLFRNLKEDYISGNEYNMIFVVSNWILEILKRVAIAIKNQETTSPLDQESIYRMYTLMNRIKVLIHQGDLKVDSITYQRLIKQLINTTTIPFHGEPAIGLQVMGVLETRNLDFDHILLLSCNEGYMPKGVDNNSFIPQSIRKAFGLTTIDMKVSIYAFYFYRMLQRARDITIMYGNATDDKNTGEKSRFMLQLMVESQLKISRKALISKLSPTIHERCEIEKTDEIMSRLNAVTKISPTAINNYLRCPLQYFYQNIAFIKEPDNESDEIDYRIFGNIFHEASQFIYEEITGVDRRSIDPQHPFANKGVIIQKQQIENVLRGSTLLQRSLDKAFMENLFKSNQSNKAPEYNGLQIINQNVIMHYLRQLLRIDLEIAPFVMRGLEGDVFTDITIENEYGKRVIKIGGRIDRLDEVIDKNGCRRIRVIDYKTGFNKEGSMDDVESIFKRENISKHSDYYLQAMLYSMIVSRSEEVNPQNLPVSPALLFIQRAGKENYDPILKINKEEISDMKKYNDVFERKLSEVISEIMDPTHPFIPTDDRKTCRTCAYSNICGKFIEK